MTLPINVIFGHLQVGRLGSAPCYGWLLTYDNFVFSSADCAVAFENSWNFHDKLFTSRNTLSFCSDDFSFSCPITRIVAMHPTAGLCLLDAALSLLWNGPRTTHSPPQCRKKQEYASGYTRTQRCRSRGKSSALTNTWTWYWTTPSRLERNETRWGEFCSRGTQSRAYRRPILWKKNN